LAPGLMIHRTPGRVQEIARGWKSKLVGKRRAQGLFACGEREQPEGIVLSPPPRAGMDFPGWVAYAIIGVDSL
jgi:hypothetical protein